MGNTKSKSGEKMNKNHSRKRGFQLGITFGKESLEVEGNIQIGWTSKTIKNYSRVPIDTTQPVQTSVDDNELEENQPI